MFFATGHALRIDPCRSSYDIAYAVDDAGYVAIDGQTILHAGGIMPQDARNHKILDLKMGWHDVEVTQVNLAALATSVTLAWRRQGDHRYETIPSIYYAPVALATVGHFAEGGPAAYSVDFGINPVAEAFTPPEFYLQRYQFEVVDALGERHIFIGILAMARRPGTRGGPAIST